MGYPPPMNAFACIAQDFDTLKETLAQESSRLQSEITCLDSERNTMEEMLSQAEAQAVDLANAWKSGNVNQRQELAKAFFPEGLLFSHELRFFEPTNTQITEMVMRYLEGMNDIGVPDGI
jgi:hypothetical protein